MKNEWFTVVAIATDDGLKYSINLLPDWMDNEAGGFSWGLPLSWKFDDDEEAKKFAEESLVPYMEAMMKDYAVRDCPSLDSGTKPFLYGFICPEDKILYVRKDTSPESLYKALVNLWYTDEYTIYPFPVEVSKNETPLCSSTTLTPINGWVINVT